MKNFFKDYGKLCKDQFGFYKKHPVGTIVFTVVSGIVGGIIGWGIPALIDKKNEKEFERKLKELENSKVES